MKKKQDRKPRTLHCFFFLFFLHCFSIPSLLFLLFLVSPVVCVVCCVWLVLFAFPISLPSLGFSFFFRSSFSFHFFIEMNYLQQVFLDTHELGALGRLAAPVVLTYTLQMSLTLVIRYSFPFLLWNPSSQVRNFLWITLNLLLWFILCLIESFSWLLFLSCSFRWRFSVLAIKDQPLVFYTFLSLSSSLSLSFTHCSSFCSQTWAVPR